MKAPIVLRHEAFCLAPAEDPIDRLRGCGAPGELLSLSFSLLSDRALDAVEISASDVIGAVDVIPKAAIELYVVHIWEQAGLGTYQSAKIRVPELLLKDDRNPIRDGYTRHMCKHWRHLVRPARFYSPPNVRLHGNVETSLVRRQCKQVWLSLKIPSSVTPGVYSGSITIKSPYNTFPVAEIGLHIEVLPIALLEPEQDLFLWYKGNLDCRLAQQYVPEKIFRAQLQDIYDHGFRSLALNERDPAFLQRAIDLATAIGFQRNVLLTVPDPYRFTDVDFKGLTPIYYISDEIDVHGTTAIPAHIANWRRVQQAQGQTMSSLIHQSFARRLFDAHDVGHAPDLLSYYAPRNLGYLLAHSEFADLHTGKTYYYWLSHMEKPNVQRVLAGLFLWKTKVDGIAPYCYQHLPRQPFSPFDDFDEWEPGFHIGDEQRPFKDHMTTYPARTGSIPTLQWKGISAGTYDLRYLTTLHALLASLATAHSDIVTSLVAEVRQRAGHMLQRISLRSIDILSETDPEPYQTIAPEEYGLFRETMARDIVALQQHLSPAGAGRC